MHHKQGLQKVLELLHLGEGSSHGVSAVGHRVVHGGEALTQPTIVTESVKQAITDAISLAPLHNPPNLEVFLNILFKLAVPRTMFGDAKAAQDVVLLGPLFRPYGPLVC